jgi:hypothetical protein
VPSDGQAIVELICPVDQIEAIQAVPTVEIQKGPIVHDDPDFVKFFVLADEDGQSDAEAVGCTVTIVKSADDYALQIANAYESIEQPPDPVDPDV